MKESDKKAFFSRKKEEPFTAKVKGKFSFSNLSSKMQNTIKKRLVEKDKSIGKSMNGEVSGLKIDGKFVTKDNIHNFEVKSEKEKVEVVKNQLYKKSDLEKLSFFELKKIGKKFGTTDRSKANIIKEILNLQN